MEKSLAKTDQTSAKAAAVMATKPAIPARRAVSGQPLGRNAAVGCSVAISRNANATSQQIVGGQRQSDEKSKTAKDCHQNSTMILARQAGARKSASTAGQQMA